MPFFFGGSKSSFTFDELHYLNESSTSGAGFHQQQQPEHQDTATTHHQNNDSELKTHPVSLTTLVSSSASRSFARYLPRALQPSVAAKPTRVGPSTKNTQGRQVEQAVQTTPDFVDWRNDARFPVTLGVWASMD